MCTYKCVGKCWNLPLWISWVEGQDTVGNYGQIQPVKVTSREAFRAAVTLSHKNFWRIKHILSCINYIKLHFKAVLR